MLLGPPRLHPEHQLHCRQWPPWPRTQALHGVAVKAVLWLQPCVARQGQGRASGPSRKEKTSVSPWSPLDLSAISSFSAQDAAQLTAWAPPGSLLWDEGHRCLISKSQWGLGICIGSKPRCWGCRVPPACQPGLRLHSLYFLPLHLLITHPKETGIIK